MPISNLKQAPYKPQKESVVTWNTWRKGLNTLLRENEIDGSEMVEATNLLLVGSGIPTKRWGSQTVFPGGATGGGRYISVAKDASDNIQVLALTDWGILTQQNGATYTPITGASWPSGYNIESTQLGGNVYIASAQRELVRYNFSTLVGFATIATPAGLSASNLSGVSGTWIYSWRVTAVGNSGGETVGSTAATLSGLPQDLTTTTVRLTWTPVSTASTVLTGYDVYRGQSGDTPVWIGGTNATITTFDDAGTFQGDPTKVVPTTDTTGGIKAKFIIRFQDRLIMAGIPGDPTKVVISGRYPNQEKFDYLNGSLVLIEPDSGEDITGITSYYNANTGTQTIIVFKERSVWELRLGELDFGQYTLVDPQYRLLTASQGCTSHRSIRAVENDIMFANARGIFILRYEPQLLNIINANEISAKIRPFFQGLAYSDMQAASAVYIDKKYILSFPQSKQTIAFDRERLSFVGPWTTPFGIADWANYVDANGTEHWLAIDSDDRYVTEFNSNYTDDKGSAINTIFKSKREDFGDWTLFKTINEIFMNFRNVKGTIQVNIYIEDRPTGKTIIAKSFTIMSSGTSGTSGLGTDELGLIGMGLSGNTPTFAAGELPKRTFIYKTSRIVQIEIKTTAATDSYELLGGKVIGIPQTRGNAPSYWLVG